MTTTAVIQNLRAADGADASRLEDEALVEGEKVRTYWAWKIVP